MAREVRLPRLGQGMETGTIVRWLKAVGDRVEQGEPLYEVDTDKATQEVEADASGVLLRIAVGEGEVSVGDTVALIGEPGETVADEPEPSAPGEEELDDGAEGDGAPPIPVEAADETDGADTRQVAPTLDFRSAITDARGGRVKASPLARRKAREGGVDLRQLSGSGPDGRIIAEDVERGGRDVSPPAAAPVAQKPAPSDEQVPAAAAGEGSSAESGAEPPAEPPQAIRDEVESVPLSSIRRTIARRLSAAWQLPVFQLTVSVEMTHANALIARSRELNPEVRVTVTDLLAKVCARALVRHPELNVEFTDEALLRHPTANVGIAVAAPQGLVVPVIPSVERLSLVEVATRRAELVARAREARLGLDDLHGGTFTISNLGMYGVEQFTAVLNPPQAAILAVGATVDRPVASAGEVVVAPMMTMTLTVDHRAVDGGPAAEFLQTVKTFLEDPALAL